MCSLNIIIFSFIEYGSTIGLCVRAPRESYILSPYLCRQEITASWHIFLIGQRYPLYSSLISASLKCHFVLLYIPLFSSWRQFWDKHTEWTQYDFETWKGHRYPLSIFYNYPTVPSCNPFCSTTRHFRDNGNFSFSYCAQWYTLMCFVFLLTILNYQNSYMHVLRRLSGNIPKMFDWNIIKAVVACENPPTSLVNEKCRSFRLI